MFSANLDRLRSIEGCGRTLTSLYEKHIGKVLADITSDASTWNLLTPDRCLLECVLLHSGIYLLRKQLVSVQNITILISKESSHVLFLQLSATFLKILKKKLVNEIDFVQNLMTFCLWKTQYLTKTSLHRHQLTSRPISPANILAGS